MFKLFSSSPRFQHSEADSASKIGEGILADFVGAYMGAVRLSENNPDCPGEVTERLKEGLERFQDAFNEMRSSLEVGFPTEDPDESETNQIKYRFLYSQRFQSEIAVLNMGDSWGVRLEDEEILLRPSIHQNDGGYVIDGVATERSGPYETLNEAVLRLLEGVISTHGACHLDYA